MILCLVNSNMQSFTKFDLKYFWLVGKFISDAYIVLT